MKRRIVLLTALVSWIVCSATTIEANTSREVFSLDQGWQFHRGDFQNWDSNAILHWRWKADDRGERSAGEMTAPGLPTDQGWQDATPGNDTFHGRVGFSWYRTVVPGAPGKPILHFQSVDDNATVYLNGRFLGRHHGWDSPFDVPTGSAWKSTGDNYLAVLVENIDGIGGIGEANVRGLDVTPVWPLDCPINPDYADQGWKTVNVPHDYIVEGEFDPNADVNHGFLPIEPAWYRKSLTIPAEETGRRLWLEFDGVSSDSTYWLNGRYLGAERSGYSSFRFDITDFAKPGGRNILVVRVNPTFEGWWYEGGGIYRHTRLVSTSFVHLDSLENFISSQVADPGNGLSADANLSIKSALINQSNSPVSTNILWEVLADSGQVVAKSQEQQEVPANSTIEVAVDKMALVNATLWSLENPYLYRLRTTLSLASGQVTDQLVVNFGVRQLRFDANHGFFLNGKPVKLQGVCCHQDHAGVGIAIPDRLQIWRLEQLKKMGCNAFRTSHNAPTPELLDGCDRLGILVMDESRHLGDTYNGKTSSGTSALNLTELTAQVKRDRNHPSVIMWSICNEEPLQGTPEGGSLAKAMRECINGLDGTRPVTSAMNGGIGNPGGITFNEDLQGVNYDPGTYKSFHDKFPLEPVFGSEIASEVGTRGVYSTETWDRYTGDQAKGYVSARGVNAPPWAQTAQDAWTPIADQEFVLGGFSWTGFDYKGEPTPFGWPCINSHFGIMDICGFPKDAFYYYKACWTHEPVLHLFPHWNWAGEEGQEISVWAYSNCDEVELFLNGVSQGKQKMPPHQHLEWKVKYAPGVLSAQGSYNGQLIKEKVETTGAPAKIVLSPDRDQLNADGSDLSVVTVKIVDNQGRTVPTAGNKIHFSVEGNGTILGVGNGDPSCHEPDKGTDRSAFNGLCEVLVQTNSTPGKIILQASAEGLELARVTLSTQ